MVPERVAAFDEIFYVHQVTGTWLMWCLRSFSIWMSTSSAVTGRPGSAPEVGWIWIFAVFYRNKQRKYVLKFAYCLLHGGPVGQNVLPLNCLKVGFKWLSTQWCAFDMCISSIIPWALTICKEISVKNSDKWYWTWQRLRKEKCVRVVPFVKHQITCGPGLKQITRRLKRKPGIGQTRL